MTVECDCGAKRQVSASTFHRIKRGEASRDCQVCKRLQVTPSRSEIDTGIRWWVHRFGGEIPRGVSAQAYVQTHGMPSQLSELVASLPPVRR